MKNLNVKKTHFKKWLILVAVVSVSACIWEGPGRHDRGRDDRGGEHQEHGDRGGHDDDSRRGDDHDDHR